MQPVVEGENTMILWDFPINTDRAILANRPDIVIKDYKSRTCLLIDMKIPTDRNISVKDFDTLSKYKDLQIEIERMWRFKTTVIPVVVGALGMIKKGVQNHLKINPWRTTLARNAKNCPFKYITHSTKNSVNIKSLNSKSLHRVLGYM